MSKFVAGETTWILAVNVPVIKTVREVFEIDLAAADAVSMEKLADDEVLLVDLLWHLCKKQATEENITPEQFAVALFGDAIGEAAVALTQAVADFFRPKKRSQLLRMTKKIGEVRDKADALAVAQMESPELMTEIETTMTTAMKTATTKALTRLSSPTNLPE